MNINLIPGTLYSYEIFAYVGGEKYSVEGTFTTEGTAKPEAPIPVVERTEYAAGDVITVSWEAVEDVFHGYTVIINSSDASFSKTIDTNMTTANFTISEEGEYIVYVVAHGYEDSELGTLVSEIKVYGDKQVSFVIEHEDGTTEVLQEQTVKHGGNATPPPVPTKTGWIFQGWDKSFLNIVEDTVVKANFKRNKYEITFIGRNPETLEEETLKKVTVDYESSVEPPEVEVPAGYQFVGWDNEDYKKIEKNTVVKASYVYENADLPLQLEVKSCEFDSDGTGYTVYYDLTNYDQGLTTGRAIVSLKSEAGRLLYTTESNAFTLGASQAKKNVEVFIPYTHYASYAEVVIVSDFESGIPISEKKTVDIIRTWSDWKTELPPETASEVETREEYRYQDKSTTTSSAPTLNGWEHEKTEGYWGEYGAWSGWSRNQYYASDSREVQTQVITDQPAYTNRQYYFYKYKKNGGWYYSYANRTGQSGVSNVEFKEIWINGLSDSRTMVFRKMDDGYEQYTCQPYQFYKVEYFYPGATQTVPAVTHTEWRCRDREYLYRHYFYKWSDWSEWSTTSYAASSTRNVQTRTVYRYKTNVKIEDAWNQESYSINGTLDASLAGKQALLVVYKGEEPADYNNEYIGQTVIGEDGSYSFSFCTRELPSVITGDFTIKMGIEGAEELLYIDTIEAPKPEYKVTFIDWNGEQISEVTVKEGDSAVAPTVPERPGYRFIGWDTGLTNVHDTMSVTAVYERKQCTVTFVDWSQKLCKSEIYNVGDDIIYPVWQEIEGYEFKGWFDENGNEVSVVEENTVLTAVYQVREYEVNFYAEDGEILSSQVVEYGDTVYAPQPPEIEGQRFVCWSTYEYSNVKKNLDIYPSYEYEETTVNPSADIKSCTIEEPIQVTLSCPDENATIFYTLDGSIPDIFSQEYTTPITIDRNVVLKFFARTESKNDSAVISEAYLMMNAEDDNGAVVIKRDELSLKMGEEAPVITYFLSHEDLDMTVEFYSLDDSVVSVDGNGQLYINNEGSTQVFVVTKDYRYADYCDITVTSDEIKLQSLEIADSDLGLLLGEEYVLETMIEPANATYQDVTWTTDDEEVVSVDQEGHIVAHAPGNTYVTAYSRAGTNIAYCFVNVEETTLELAEQEIKLAVGQNYQLNLRVAGEQEIKWQTGNTNIVSVSDTGLVTAHALGTTTVIVTAQNGEFRTCVVRVLEAQEPPSAPVIKAVTASTIEVEKQENCEYSIDKINWTENTVFTGLEVNTVYTIYGRVKETTDRLASDPSQGTEVKTSQQIFTITFDKNSTEAIGNMSSQRVEAGSTVLLNANQFTRENYNFAGWNTKADGTGTSYADGASVSGLVTGSETTITLYAQWTKPNQVTSPSANLPSGSKVEEGTQITLTCSDVRADIYYTTDGSEPTKESTLYIEPIVVNESVTIKAIACREGYLDSEVIVLSYTVTPKVMYTITFDKNSAEAVGSMENQSEAEGSVAVLKQNRFTRKGYQFTGWNTKADGTGTVYADRTPVASIDFGNSIDLTLYAQWEEIRYVAKPTANIADGNVVVKGTLLTISCNTLGAEIYYTIDGTTPSKKSTKYEAPIVLEESVRVKAIAVKEGYEDSEILEVSFEVTEEEIIYTFHFDKNSAEAVGEMLPQTLAVNDWILLNYNAFMWEGYLFNGWNTKADGTGAAYRNGQLIEGYEMSGETEITLYAQWEKMETLEAVTASEKTGITLRKGTKVMLEHPVKQVVIRYTTDGTIPTEESPAYTQPFVITEDITILAIAYKDRYLSSEPAAFSYRVAKSGEVYKEDIPEGGIGKIPAGLWIAGLNPEGYDYTGKAVNPQVRVYDHMTLLEETKDYTISYSRNIKANDGTNAKTAPTITVKGKGNYSGKDTAVFKINARDINAEGILAYDVSASYNEKTQKPVPVVYENGKKLKHKKDYTLEYVDMGKAGAFQEPGDYVIRIHGNGNYTGTRDVSFAITETALISKASVSKIKNQSYKDGEEIRPLVEVKYKGEELVENVDYTISYVDNTKVGKATVILRGMGEFSGVKYVNFNIVAVPLKQTTVYGTFWEVIYTGKEIGWRESLSADNALYYNGKPLKEGVDFDVTYKNNTKVGKATVIFTGINGYTGTIKKSFKITPYSIWSDRDDRIMVYTNTVDGKIEYEKGGAKPEVTVVFGNQKLIENVDYKLTYKKNQTVVDEDDDYGISEVGILGKGNFKEEVWVRYNVIRKDISNLEAVLQDVVFKNKAGKYKAVPKILDTNGKALTLGKDYEKEMVYRYVETTTLADGTIREAGSVAEAADIVPAGTRMQVTVTGIENYKGELTAEYRVVEKSLVKAKVKIAPQIYTGEKITLEKNQLTVLCGKETLKASDYEIVGYEKNAQKGTAKVTLKGVGNYGGTVTASFKIKSKTFSWWK